jgi:hypothetical protein
MEIAHAIVLGEGIVGNRITRKRAKVDLMRARPYPRSLRIRMHQTMDQFAAHDAACRRPSIRHINGYGMSDLY